MSAPEQLAFDFDSDPHEGSATGCGGKSRRRWPDLRRVPLDERVKVARRLIQAEPGVDERAEILAAAIWPGGAS
jgi:hypothetical protein